MGFNLCRLSIEGSECRRIVKWSQFSLHSLNNFIYPTSSIDISANVTFSGWPNYESVPIDASGEPIPIVSCPITHQEFEIGDSIARINRCGHVFSEQGLRRWLRTENSCPMCRSQVDSSYNIFDFT